MGFTKLKNKHNLSLEFVSNLAMVSLNDTNRV